jgi:hypothetical protein
VAPDDKDPGESGSVEVQLSSDRLPAAKDAAAPEAVPPDESQPVSSGRVRAVEAADQTGPHRPSRSHRITGMVSSGVEKLGTGMTVVGEGVTKLGDVTKRIPIVGKTAHTLGEGLTKAGETLAIFPEVTKTRRGRLLVRSVIVGLLLVAAWISVMVFVQVRTNDTPDLRPEAEDILIEISKGPEGISKVYEEASPRFLEIVKSKEHFLDDMNDLNATLGKFKEITAINDTLVTRGPTGKLARISLTAAFEHGNCKGSISFHYDDDKWKLFGIAVEVPSEVKITQAQREQRVAACLDEKGHDISRDLSPDPKLRQKCPVRDLAETILENIRDGKAGEVYDKASPVLKNQQTRESFIAIQEDHRRALGDYKRLLDVTEARAIGGTSASYDALAEFDRSSGVRVVFGFERDTKSAPWLLRSYKVVVPMPRAIEDQPPPPPPPAKKK